MGLTAENLAREFKIRREDQDAFALLSNQRAVAAAARGPWTERFSCPRSSELRRCSERGQWARENQSTEALAR